MAAPEIYERYSIMSLRNIVNRALREMSISDIAKQSGLARSTLYDLLNGTLADVKLSTASKIVVAIKEIKCKKHLTRCSF